MKTKKHDRPWEAVEKAVKDFFNGIQRTWKTLAKGAAWIGVAVGPLVLLPDYGISDQKTWIYFASFVLSVGVGLLFLMANQFSEKQHVLAWAIASAAFILLASAGFLAFQSSKTNYTVEHEGLRWIIATTEDLMPDPRNWKHDHPSASDATLIEQFGADRYRKGEIWDLASLQQRWFRLALLYVPTVQFFGFCIISLGQAIRCSVAPELPKETVVSSRRRRRKGAAVSVSKNPAATAAPVHDHQPQ